MRNFLFEGLNVDEWDKDHGASDLRGIKLADEFFNRDDRGVLSTVGARDESEDRTTLRAVDDDHGDIGGGGGVDARQEPPNTPLIVGRERLWRCRLRKANSVPQRTMGIIERSRTKQRSGQKN